MKAVHARLRFFSRLARALGLSRCAGPDGAPAPAAPFEVEARERLTQRILSTIHNNSILLCGAPGCGKRSILIELGKRLARCDDPATDFFPVYLDLHSVPERLLFATVADAVLGQLAFETPTRVDCFGATYSHRDLVKDFRAVIRALGARTSRKARLVLLVEGIDALNRYHPRTMQKIRSLFMTSLGGALVMVATAIEIDKRWDREGSPWYNFFEEINLSAPGAQPTDRPDRRDTMTRDGRSSST